MAAFAKHHIHQAGNKFNSKIQNGDHGAQLVGNFNVGGNLKVQTYEKSFHERLRECRKALHFGCSDPWDDRAKIVAIKAKKGRIITAHCEWITTHNKYRSWENVRTSSQLLWISSVEERGKTMMAIHLSQELEKATKQTNDSTVLYFFIDRQDKRDTAVHVLKGLLTRLIKEREDLTRHLLEEFELQKEALFSKDAIEALWRVFVKMVTDPTAGQVYCIIDGLDYCTDDSLRRLISRITNFFLEEPQAVIDEDVGTHSYHTSAAGPSSTQRRSERRRSAGLKMILVSREKPDWVVEQLSDFPHIDIGARGRRSNAASQSAPASSRRPPTLASVAASVLHKQRIDELNNNNAGAQQNSSNVNQVAPQSAFPLSDHSNASASMPKQLPASVSNPAFLTVSPIVSPAHTQTPSLQTVSSTTTPIPHAQVIGPNKSVHPQLNDPRTSLEPNRQAWVTSPSPSPSQPLISEPSAMYYSRPVDNHGSAPVPQPPLESESSHGPPLYDQNNKAAGYCDDTKIDEGEIEEDYGDEALRLYIEASLEESCAEKQYPTEIQSYIIAALEHRGDDTFLWVDFAIEEIRNAKADNIEAVLNSLPPTLTEMYSFILLRIPPNLIDLVAGLLRWSVCAREPLKVVELTVVLNLTQYSSDVAENLVRTAVRACGNMMTISSDNDVNIVHNSLVDFLSDESSPIYQDPRLNRFIIHANKVHSDIANFCIAYLEAGCFNEGSICLEEDTVAFHQRLAQYPFMTYAASFWPHHLREAGNPYLDLSSPFFQSKSKIRKNWWITYWSFSTGKSTLFAPRDFTLLHLASYLDLVCIAQKMLQRGDLQNRLDKKDSHAGTALEYAVVHGHMDMFQFLIRVGASQKGMFETLLELACRKGQRDIAAVLLDMGYNVNVRAQTVSVKQSMYGMARWLPGAISEGLDLTRDSWSLMFRDVGEQETPLARAAEYGHIAVVELLLDRGAIVNAGTTKGFTPLHAASYSGQIECLEILIKHGGMVSAQTTDRWLALHFAASRGKLAVVEKFLDMGIHLESTTIKSKTALHLAAYSGHAEVVRALVKRGANLELRSHKGETPLHLATRNRKAEIVELLLSLGANRHAVTNEGKMATTYVQKSTSVEGKECLRILQTFGMEGYQSWQSPTDAETVTESSSAPTTGKTQQTPRKDSAASMPTQRSFAPVVAPVSYPIHGIQAEFTLSGQYQASRLYEASRTSPASVYTPAQQTNQGPPMFPQMNQVPPPFQAPTQWYPPNQQPSFNRMQSDPTHGPSKFTYDPNTTMQNFPAQQYRQDDGPPPYVPPVAGSSFQVPPSFPEESSSTMVPGYTSSQGMWQNTSLAQTGDASPTAPARSQSQYSIPTTALPTIAQQPAQGSMVQMINSMSLNPNLPPSNQVPMAPIAPNQAPTQPTTSITTSQYNQTGHFGAQSPSTSIPTIHTPITPVSPPVYPATAPAVTPFQPPSPIQLPHTPQFQQTPQQYFAHHRSQTVPIVQPPQPYQQPQQQYPTAYPPSPYLTTPPQQLYSPPPVQSPHFSGNSTASTYNATYEYSAPAVTQPYTPGLGINGNGLLFAPPPTQEQGVKKRKSFLGGLIG